MADDETEIDPEDAPEDEPASVQEGDGEEEAVDAEAEEAEGDADGDEDDGQSNEEADDEWEEIDWNGRTRRLPKSVIPDLRAMQADYTRKGQEMAEQRRALETERASVTQQVQQAEAQEQLVGEMAKLHAFDASLAQFEQVDWGQLFDQNPVEAQKLDFQRRQLLEQRQRIADGIEQKKRESSEAAQREFAKAVQEGQRVLQQKIPGWGPDIARQIVEYGQRYGYSDQELASVADPRPIEILHKARLWDQHVEKTKAAAKPKPKADVKPLARPAKGRAPARTGLHDDLPPEEWIKRRNQELAKKQRA